MEIAGLLPGFLLLLYVKLLKKHEVYFRIKNWNVSDF